MRSGLFGLHGSALCHGDITVPHMGDSISEGTIASVLKKAGDSVAVDEVVAQIETDKVTIDCKSGEAGVVQAVMVQAGAVVKPGQVVVSVTPGGGGGSGSAGASASAPKPMTPVAAAPSPSHAASGSSSHGARTPGIHFPPRRTAQGERISDLPAEKQEQLLSSRHATPVKSQATAASAPAPSSAPAAPTVSKAKVVTTILQSVPSR